MRHVYILRCADDTLYTGITTDVSKRLSEHNSSPKGATYTVCRRPVTLVWSQTTETRSSASSLERQLKRLTRAQKLEMISPPSFSTQ